MSVSLFLGAGASVPYDKPTTKSFRDALLPRAERRNILHAALSSPLHEDIEDVFTAVVDLVELAQSDGGKFYVEHNKQLKGEVGAIYGAYNFLLNEVHEAYAWNHDYDESLHFTLGPLVAMLEVLGKTVNIFTTNYDRGVELYCGTADPQIELVDGFVHFGGRYVWGGWAEPAGGAFNDEDQQEGARRVRLHKLHGSLTWRSNHATGEIVKNETEELSRDRNYGNLLIYPSKSPKIDGSEPYNSTFEAFSNTLGLFDACIVVGFSFRDEYITDKFKEFLDAGRLIIVVDPEGLDTIEKSMPEYMELVVVDMPGSPAEHLLPNTGGGGRGRIVVMQESLGPDTSQRIASRALEHIQQWDAEAMT